MAKEEMQYNTITGYNQICRKRGFVGQERFINAL